MAWKEDTKSGIYHAGFRFGGKAFKRSLKTSDEGKANAKLSRIEETIEMIESGRLPLPLDVDIGTFILSDGKLNQKPQVLSLRLGSLGNSFFADSSNFKADNTRKTMDIHRTHLVRELGKSFDVCAMQHQHLQKYINIRSKAPGRFGKLICGNTIGKEITTFRAMFNWGQNNNLISDLKHFPSQNLNYPADRELPRFECFDDVLEKTAGLDPESADFKELWSCVFLTKPNIEELLDHVQINSTFSFVYPMFTDAAHTGTRRSELLRSQLFDWDEKYWTIREKKRKKSTASMRTVPVSARMAAATTAWINGERSKDQPFLFCHTGGTRSNSKAGDPISPDEAHSAFTSALKRSKWQHLPGWHVFRHSYCTNSAIEGIDQRHIDSVVGHTTEEMRRRYRHLRPDFLKKSLLYG